MTSDHWLQLLKYHRAIAVIRTDHLVQGLQMARAIAAAGMALIEITWNSDRPHQLIRQLRAELPRCYIGAGTLFTPSQVSEAVAAGAQFLFTPHIAPDLLLLAQAAHVPLVMGALSPTEIVTAWQAGASAVKVFPIKAVGGADYIRCLQGPLGHIPLIPTGGVTLANAKDLLTAGAIAVGLAGELFPKGVVASEDWSMITAKAEALSHHIAGYRCRVE